MVPLHPMAQLVTPGGSGAGAGLFFRGTNCWSDLDSRNGFRMEMVFFGIAVIGATGLALNGLVSLAEHRVLRWRPGHR
jgi:hypothetical protein